MEVRYEACHEIANESATATHSQIIQDISLLLCLDVSR